MKKVQKQVGVVTARTVISKQSEVLQQDTMSPLNGMQMPPIAFSVLAELQSFNAWHGRCINIKAQIVAGLGFECGDVAQAFFDRHASYAKQPITETLVNIQKDYEEFGNAFMEIVRNKAGELAEIYHIPARYCFIYADKETGEQYLSQEVGLTKRTFTAFGAKKKRPDSKNEYIHMKNYSSQSVFYGVPEWMGATGAIVLDRNGVEYNAAKFSNNAVPDFIVLVSGGDLGEDSMKAIQSFWQTNFKGTSNAGKTLVLASSDASSKIEVKELGTSNKDASYTTMRRDARDEVVAAHGVPPLLAGISESGKLGGGKEGAEQMRMFKELVIKPRQARLEFIFNELLFPAMGIMDAQVKFNAIDLTDSTSDSDIIAKLVPLGVVTPTEGREMLGLKGDAPALPALPAAAALSAADGSALVKSLVELRKQLEATE